MLTCARAATPRLGASCFIALRLRVVEGLTGAPPEPEPLARSRPPLWEAFRLSARPAARMFLAALWSRSCTVAHDGHFQEPMCRGSASSRRAHIEQVLVERYGRTVHSLSRWLASSKSSLRNFIRGRPSLRPLRFPD